MMRKQAFGTFFFDKGMDRIYIEAKYEGKWISVTAFQDGFTDE